MFTGLIQGLGTVIEVDRRCAPDARLQLETSYQDLVLGESLAVNGVCLTVADLDGSRFGAVASAETLRLTTLGELERGSRTHLERAIRAGDPIGGHLVTGHVDGVGRLLALGPVGDSVTMTVEVPVELASLVAPKGSIAVDGTSLTVNLAAGRVFEVMLVPYTRRATLLDKRPIGSRLNLEVDVLAKYVARALGKPGVDGRPT